MHHANRHSGWRYSLLSHLLCQHFFAFPGLPFPWDRILRCAEVWRVYEFQWTCCVCAACALEAISYLWPNPRSEVTAPLCFLCQNVIVLVPTFRFVSPKVALKLKLLEGGRLSPGPQPSLGLSLVLLPGRGVGQAESPRGAALPGSQMLLSKHPSSIHPHSVLGLGDQEQSQPQRWGPAWPGAGPGPPQGGPDPGLLACYQYTGTPGSPGKCAGSHSPQWRFLAPAWVLNCPCSRWTVLGGEGTRTGLSYITMLPPLEVSPSDLLTSQIQIPISEPPNTCHWYFFVLIIKYHSFNMIKFVTFFHSW